LADLKVELDRERELAREYAYEIVLGHPALQGLRGEVGVVLAGSRAVGYHVPSSDYDFLVLCDRDAYATVARRAQRGPEAPSVDLAFDKEQIQERYGIDVDVAAFQQARVARGLGAHRDVLLWIWTHAKALHDPRGRVQRLQAGITAYPREVLERKLKRHWLIDFQLSVHGITYRYESQNVFSVVHALGAKIAEYCRLCCLLDGRPFPYAKWLLRACRETTNGAKIIAYLERALGHVTHLGDDLVESAERVREAVYAMDTEACDVLEEAMVAWGIEEAWVKNAYGQLANVLFE
jgi:predicted nucleotidyltransferase